jgi:predicted metal-binding membrane protein
MQAQLDLAAKPGPSTREAAPLWAVLAALGAVAWVVTVREARVMGIGPGTMGMAFPAFTWMWVAMMAAMMLPAIGLLAAGETVGLGAARAGRGWRVPGVLAFGAGFLVPWAAYGGLAFTALLGTGRLVEVSPGVARWLGVGILAVAGAYQLSPWKLWALNHCRMPMHPAGVGLRGDLASGLRDGALCVGCCWALMAVLVAVGVMNLAGMAGLAAVIFAEKVMPRPRLVAAVAGVALLGLAVAAAVHPSLLSGLTGSGVGMDAGAGGMASGRM